MKAQEILLLDRINFFFSTCLCFIIRQTNSNVNIMPGSDNSSKMTQMSKPTATDLKLNTSPVKAPMVPINTPNSAGKPG